MFKTDIKQNSFIFSEDHNDVFDHKYDIDPTQETLDQSLKCWEELQNQCLF